MFQGLAVSPDFPTSKCGVHGPMSHHMFGCIGYPNRDRRDESFGSYSEIIAASPFHSEFRIQAGDTARVPLQCLRRRFIYNHNSMHIEYNFTRNPEITIDITFKQGLQLLRTPSCTHHCFFFEPCHLPQQL